MSKHVRAPLVLIAALAMTLGWVGPAGADPATPTTTPVEVTEETTGQTGSEGTGTEASETEETGTGAVGGVLGDVAGALTEGKAPLAIPEVGGASVSGSDSSSSSSSSSSSAASTAPANPATCIQTAIEKLLTGLVALGPEVPMSPALLEEGLEDLLPSDPTGIADFLAELGLSPDNLAEGRDLVEEAITTIEGCLPTPPSGGGTGATPTTQAPRPTQAAQQPAAFTYKNCDEARAYGAAPVYAGQYGYGSHLDSDSDGIGCEETAGAVTQPVAYSGGGKLAYTGVATEPLVAWGAALLASGAWLILSGRRRA